MINCWLVAIRFTYMVSFQCSAIICSTADAYITIQCILKFYFAEEMHGTDDVTCCSRCGDLNIFAWRCYKGMYVPGLITDIGNSV